MRLIVMITPPGKSPVTFPPSLPLSLPSIPISQSNIEAERVLAELMASSTQSLTTDVEEIARKARTMMCV